MNFTDEQVSKFDLYGYHITTLNKLKIIKYEGLIPLCGERSRSIGDNLDAVYFFSTLMRVKDWANVLYKKEEQGLLELLRFSLNGINFKIRDAEFGDFYTINRISSEKIELLQRVDLTGNPYLLENLLDQRKENLIWEPIESLNDNRIIENVHTRTLNRGNKYLV